MTINLNNMTKGLRLFRSRPGARGKLEGLPHVLLLTVTLISVSTLLMVAGFLIINSIPAFQSIGLAAMLFGTTWDPTSHVSAAFGMLPLLGGTFLVSILASLIAIPVGIGCTIYLSEIAHPRVRALLKPAIELLAGIPSVVYGLFALLILQDWLAGIFGLSSGYVALNGGIILAVMMVPIIVTLSEDAIASVPRELREAAYALGATRWETMRSVVLPAALSGIVAAIILSIMRAVGETMAVLMAVSQTPLLTLDPFSGVQTMTATIAIEMGETAVGSIHYSALFAVGVVLFAITLIMNTIADLVMRRFSEAYQ